ncbi:hypothetical protein TREES_T100009574 [Tupaia chinensis]|uniref:Uncharacterized protein n=1 Tax=Tupaia chinensis TaxID=246437 RepID=L9LCZ1_TUPCH|nr:hypothetical protein TREES_T100009574 [Tupaia chinensis]
MSACAHLYNHSACPTQLSMSFLTLDPLAMSIFQGWQLPLNLLPLFCFCPSSSEAALSPLATAKRAGRQRAILPMSHGLFAHPVPLSLEQTLEQPELHLGAPQLAVTGAHPPPSPEECWIYPSYLGCSGLINCYIAVFR